MICNFLKLFITLLEFIPHQIGAHTIQPLKRIVDQQTLNKKSLFFVSTIWTTKSSCFELSVLCFLTVKKATVAEKNIVLGSCSIYSVYVFWKRSRRKTKESIYFSIFLPACPSF